MTLPLPVGPLPGVPTPMRDDVDRGRHTDRVLSELRQGQAGVLRPIDDVGNLLFASDPEGAGWGISRPRLDVGLYRAIPDVGTAGYTFTVALAATFKPASQQINLGVRWSFQELPTPTNTGIAEFEIRANKGKGPSSRGEGITDSWLVDSWDSGVAGSKGLDGTLNHDFSYVWPQDGSVPIVGYEEAGFVTIAVWARTRPATGTAADIARVTPMWCYQSGNGEA